eukprot:2249214-Rhodomonas_salina.1
MTRYRLGRDTTWYRLRRDTTRYRLGCDTTLTGDVTGAGRRWSRQPRLTLGTRSTLRPLV